MRKLFTFFTQAIILSLFLGTVPAIASAACNPFFVVQGGTGNCSLNTGFIPFGAGTSPFATSTGLFWTAASSRLTFTNGSSTNQTISGNLFLTALGTPAGTILAVDPNGKVIATSTAAGGVTSVTGTWPILSSGGNTPIISWGGLSTTTNLVSGHVVYSSGVGSITDVATTSHSFSGPFGITGTIGALIGGSNSTITWTGLATTSQPSSGNLLESNGSAGVFGVATSSLGVTSPITFSGTLGAQAGGSGGNFACATCLTTNQTITLSGAVSGSGSTAITTTYAGILGNTLGGTGQNSSSWTGVAAVNSGIWSQYATSTISCSGNISCTSFAGFGASTITLTGAVPIVNGGTATTTGGNTNGVEFYDGSKITNDTSLIHTTSGSLTTITNASTTALSVNNHVVIGDRFLTFSYATTTAWAGTTTLPLIVIPNTMLFSSVQCITNVGTLWTQIQYGTTPTLLAPLNASTTINTFAFSTNNTPAAAATSTISFGNPASSPVSVSCTIRAQITGQ